MASTSSSSWSSNSAPSESSSSETSSVSESSASSQDSCSGSSGSETSRSSSSFSGSSSSSCSSSASLSSSTSLLSSGSLSSSHHLNPGSQSSFSGISSSESLSSSMNPSKSSSISGSLSVSSSMSLSGSQLVSYSEERRGGSPSSSDPACPGPDDGLTDMMDPDHWERHLDDNSIVPFNWFVHEGPIWRVRPTACGTDQSAETACTNAKIKNPPPGGGTPRNQNTLFSKCKFSDFALELKFRCPNARSTTDPDWDDCTSPVKGPQNWGNSGIKIFRRSGDPRPIEVQILDSVGIDWPGNEAARKVVDKTDLGGCDPGDSRAVTFGEICGALYKLRTPDSNPVNQAAGWPNPTSNDWNTLRIEYMAARFSANNTNNANKEKCATITVTLNTQTIHTRWGYKDTPAGTQLTEDVDKDDNPIYQNGEGWYREIGPILLQEHDSKVQFKDIKIHAGWLPKSNGSFDSNWQHTYQNGQCS